MLRTALNRPDAFTLTYELVPGKGCGGRRLDRLLEFSRKAKEDGRIKALSITDNPGGNPALAPVAIGTELLKIGIEPLIHFSLKDKNRSQIVSHLYLYQRLRLHSLLVLGGDFPHFGYYGQARPVFDLDSMQTLQLMQDMEQGRYPDPTGKKKQQTRSPALFKGCVVSPFKTSEAEQIWQYVKLLHKVRAGADFIISQLGFDIRKFGELMIFLRQHNINLPMLANIFVPSLPVARAMAAGRVPGVLLSRNLVKQMEDEERVGNRQARLDRAAIMIAQVKRWGYQGVHLGGNGLRFRDICSVLNRFEQLDREEKLPGTVCDFPLSRTWYFYRQTASGKRFGSNEARSLNPGKTLGTAEIYSLSHSLLFNNRSLISRMFARFCLFCAQGKQRTALLIFTEKAVKRLFFNCRMCGDCTLARSTYLCPQSGCPKRLVNGPCGGSRKGFCEVFPQRRCFWVRVYDRLDPQSTVDSLAAVPPLPPKDWALEKTSSWIHYFAASEKDAA